MRHERNFYSLMKNTSLTAISTTEINLGRRLREIRIGHGLSIRALARQSGLNVNTLSAIENNKTSPSVSTLQQVASALKLPINAFFESKKNLKVAVYQKDAKRQTASFTHGTLADLGAGFARAGLEPFLVTLEPGADSGDTPIVHTGLEFVYCRQGSINYEVDQETYRLEPGDSLVFEAHLPHRWWNAGSAPSQSLLILCPSDERDHPDERHFSTGA
jgi:transcriptional regulator with XRE-family HTH domain